MWKEKVNKFNFFILCLLAAFPIYNGKVTVILIISFTIVAVVSGLAYGIPLISKTRIKEALLFIALFILIFFRTYFTDRSPDSLFYLEVSLSLLAFPAAFFLTPVRYTQKQKTILSFVFSLSTLAIIFYGQLRAAHKLSQYVGTGKFWPDSSAVFSDPSFPYLFRTVFEQHAHIHPTYASVLLGISVLLMLDHFLKSYSSHTRKSVVLYTSLLLIFVLLQGLLASRTPIVATMLCSVVLIFIYLKKKIFALYALGGIIALSVMLMLMVPSITTRFKEISFSNTNAPTAENENSFNIRVGIYKCSTGIIKDNWAWGIGPGNVQKELNTCYNKISKAVYDQKNYNTHNQFLDYWAGLGIFGPTLLLLILLYTSVRNYKIKIPLPFAISLLFFVAMLTENMLIRQNGIVPFAFFTGLYFFSDSSNRLTSND